MVNIGKLSCRLVLATRLIQKENFINAFDHFDYEKIAEYGEEDIERLANDAGIIRHKGKIRAAIANARAFMKVQDEFGTFDTYIWDFVSGEQVVSQSR